MKRYFTLLVAVIMIFALSSITAFADETQSLDELIESMDKNIESEAGIAINDTDSNTDKLDTPNTYEKNKDYIEGINRASDLITADVEGVETITSGAKLVAAWIVQVLSYVIIAFLVVRTIIDICFIAIPFTRSFLGNGYSGQAQSSGAGNMGGQGSYGMRGGYGMFSGNNNSVMEGQNAMMNRNSSMVGNIQFVSNAALNAVATESAIGPDGKTQSPYKLYAKDMVVTFITVPILVLLAATGVLNKLGLAIGGFLVDTISKLSSMI